VIREVLDTLGDAAYAVDEPSLEAVCLRLLTERGLTFASAESCTGGLIAKRITDLPGASNVFLGGVVSYTNGVKAKVLGVPVDTLDEFGAVSRETALAMAQGVRTLTGADLAVSVTGICGPASDDRDTPVGTGFVGFAAPDRLVCRPIQMGRDRDLGRMRAASNAFDMLRRWLTGCLEDR
jgi:nicotinamide-nucleotide amidase